MHSGKAYRLFEFLIWTRRNIYWLLVVGIFPVVLYEVAGLDWIAIPFSVVALLGTATAFLVGFKNTQTYNRTWEARQIWGGILNSSRTWGTMCRDFIKDHDKTRVLVYRHFAWLTAMRYQLREGRPWETASKLYNKEYQAFYTIPERESTLEEELAKYIPSPELAYVLSTKNRAVQLMSLQSRSIRELLDQKEIDIYQFLEMHKMVGAFYDGQGKSERIKNFPYPRQFATINSLFI